MNSIEIFALVVAILTLVKIGVILINPKSWISVIRKCYGKPIIGSVIGLILAAVVLYNLVLYGITIQEVFAVMLFIVLLLYLGVLVYSKELISMAEKMLKDKKLMKKAWLPILIWLALIVWLLWALFA